MLDNVEHSSGPTSLAARRADATREAIVDAAWELSRRHGLNGWSLRTLARSLGITAPTLYAYVDSKHAIYDAMFQQGWERLAVEGASWAADAPEVGDRVALKEVMRRFVSFCTVDSTRYQLMFQRVVPDFVPSADAYAASVAVYDQLRQRMAALGIIDDADLDLWTALATGLTDQQISNDPGGDRWIRLLDTAVDMFCDHLGVGATPEG